MSNPKKKLLLVVPYFHPKTGGLEQYALHVALRVKEAGWDVVVVTTNHVARKRIVQRTKGLKVYRLPIWFVASNTPVNPLWYFNLREIIATEQPDVINAHSPVPFISDMAALASGSIPFVLTYHAATLRKPGRSLANVLIAAYRPLERLTFAKATAVVAVSQYVKDQFSSKIAEKTRIVTNAVEPHPNPANYVRDGFVFVGSLDKTHSWKGLDQILQAQRIYEKRYGEAPTLRVVGDGDAKRAYQELTTKLQSSEVAFVGHKAGREKEELIAGAKALIAYPTSANDAFPTVFLEAWNNATPVIASAIGPIPTIIQDGEDGLLVPPHNPGELVEAMRLITVDPGLARKMGKAGRHRIDQELNWTMQGTRTLNLFEALR